MQWRNICDSLSSGSFCRAFLDSELWRELRSVPSWNGKINLYFFLMKRKHLLSDSVICARSSWLAHLFARRESSRQDGELTKEDHGAQFTKKKTNHTSEIWVPTVTAKVLNPHLHPSDAGIIHLDEAFGHFERAVGLWPTLGPPDLQQGVVNALWRYPGGRNSSMSFPMMVGLSDF